MGRLRPRVQRHLLGQLRGLRELRPVPRAGRRRDPARPHEDPRQRAVSVLRRGRQDDLLHRRGEGRRELLLDARGGRRAEARHRLHGHERPPAGSQLGLPHRRLRARRSAVHGRPRSSGEGPIPGRREDRDGRAPQRDPEADDHLGRRAGGHQPHRRSGRLHAPRRHLDDAGHGWHGKARHAGPGQRPVAPLLAGRQADRLLLEQERQQRPLPRRSRVRGHAPAHEASRQRLLPRLVAGRQEPGLHLRAQRQQGDLAPGHGDRGQDPAHERQVRRRRPPVLPGRHADRLRHGPDRGRRP